MVELIEQLALLDALLSNWTAIRASMGPIGAASELGLAAIAARMSAARAPGEIARALDDLLELVEGTPAERYVRELLARSQLGDDLSRKVRGTAFATPEVAQETALVEEVITATAHTLGAAAAATTGLATVPVFFATNRRMDDKQAAEKRFTGEPDKTITLGFAPVTIPVTRHRMGTIETPSWWNVFADPKDASRYVVMTDPERLSGPEFCTKLARAANEGAGASVLLFLHGYNVTFEEAVRRAAQLVFDIKFRGPVVVFSWPSLGQTLGYFADEERAALSAECLCRFLEMLGGGPWAQVHLVAHSMGNRVMLLALANAPPATVHLGQIVFVAADVYTEVFEQKFPNLTGIGERKTSYAAKADRALLVSSLLHRAPRVGITSPEPFVHPGMETIDASAVDSSLLSLGHSYYGDERSVITDIGYLLREGLPAARRGLEQPLGKPYWRFPR